MLPIKILLCWGLGLLMLRFQAQNWINWNTIRNLLTNVKIFAILSNEIFFQQMKLKLRITGVKPYGERNSLFTHRNLEKFY